MFAITNIRLSHHECALFNFLTGLSNVLLNILHFSLFFKITELIITIVVAEHDPCSFVFVKPFVRQTLIYNERSFKNNELNLQSWKMLLKKQTLKW